MSSDRKIEANQANAQLSTGPKTEEGKAISSQNARKHGLNSKHLHIPEDRTDEYNDMARAFYDEIRPVTEIQMAYFDQLLHAAWNLNIAREIHAAAVATFDEPRMDRMLRHIAHYERSFAKAHKALKDEQTDLAMRAMPENEPIQDLPIACRIKHIANEATRVARLTERTQQTTRRKEILAAVGGAFRPEPASAAETEEKIAA